MEAWPGKPYPLGATWDGKGVNFALFSQNLRHFWRSQDQTLTEFATRLPEAPTFTKPTGGSRVPA